MRPHLKELRHIFRELKSIQRPSHALKHRASTALLVSNVLDRDPRASNDQVDLSCHDEQTQHANTVLEQKIAVLEEQIACYKRQVDGLLCENTEYRERVKTLRDEIIHAKGAIRVLCRIRPSPNMHGTGIGFGDKCVFVDDKKFRVDGVFGTQSTQADIYGEMAPLIEGVLDGYQVCIFAYGQTGSGKTHTMEGTCEDKGLVYRSLDRISVLCQELVLGGFKIEYRIKYLEVYNEGIRDLIGESTVQITHENGAARLRNCKEITTSNILTVYDVVQQSGTRRAVGGTKCNSQSSRSHSVLILTVDISSASEKREGVLVLIDLAGSERLSESKAENVRLKETQNINKSLSALGNVFTALKRKSSHVPFRDSKLTHLMQDYLTGKSRTTMIVNVNPENAGETICSLRFATKVSECELGNAGRNALSKV